MVLFPRMHTTNKILTSAVDSSCVSNRGLPLFLLSSLLESDSSRDRLNFDFFSGWAESSRTADMLVLYLDKPKQACESF